MESQIQQQTRKNYPRYRGRTHRISLIHDLDPDLWPWASNLCKLWSWPTHVLTFKVNGHSAAKIEWKQTDGQTDGCDCITSLANAVGNNLRTDHYRYLIDMVEKVQRRFTKRLSGLRHLSYSDRLQVPGTQTVKSRPYISLQNFPWSNTVYPIQ